MVNFHPQLVKALSSILPTHYEMVLTSKTPTPCISYMELTNSATDTGDTVGYSRLTYQVKVWANELETIQHYALEIDKVLKPMGFKRISSAELYDNQSTMMQKILTYEALALEKYNSRGN